jgi:hypothetical protein
VTHVTRARSEPGFVVLQRAYDYGYRTEFLGWVLNRDELLRVAQHFGLSLVREFNLPWPRAIDRAPETVGDSCFLFKWPAEGA